MKSKAFKSIVLTTVLAATMLLFLSAVQVTVTAADTDVEINELFVDAYNYVASNQWVEIINTGASDVNVSGWYITNTTHTVGTVPDPGPVLGSYETYVFDPLTLSISRSGTLVLYDKAATEIERVTYINQYPSQSSGQIYDGEYDLWEAWMVMSKGYPNHIHSGPGLKVNEVLAYHDSGGAPEVQVEFIEVINTGGSAVDLTGWKLRSRYYAPYDMMGSIGAGEHLVYYKGTNQTFSMTNSYGTVAIHNADGTAVDYMIYGHFYLADETGAQAYYPYETNWAAPQAHSYERVPAGKDTDQDVNDFYDNPNPSPCSLLSMPPGVGGQITPVDKLLMLMPWIGLASAIAIAAATTTIIFKKRRL